MHASPKTASTACSRSRISGEKTGVERRCRKCDEGVRDAQGVGRVLGTVERLHDRPGSLGTKIDPAAVVVFDGQLDEVRFTRLPFRGDRVLDVESEPISAGFGVIGTRVVVPVHLVKGDGCGVVGDVERTCQHQVLHQLWASNYSSPGLDVIRRSVAADLT